MKTDTEPAANRTRVLIVKLSSLGDLFHALPAVHNLKVGLDADIDWVVQEEYAELARCFADVSAVIPFRRKGWVSGLPSLVRELRSRRYDLVIDLQGLLKSALVSALARGARRIGPSFHREGSALFYTGVAGPRNKRRHAVEENLDIARYLGLRPLELAFPVAFPTVELTASHPRVAFLPVSRWVTKNWPPHRFADLGRRLQDALGASIFLLGGGADGDVCQAIQGSLREPVFNLAGQQNLVELGGILAQMDLLIANDSGPVHMAAALGVPALVIFGPTDAARTGPYGPIHRTVDARGTCRPCFSRKCRRGGVPCLAGVTPARVSEIAMDMLRTRLAARGIRPAPPVSS